jgi:hypothetical protein
VLCAGCVCVCARTYIGVITDADDGSQYIPVSRVARLSNPGPIPLFQCHAKATVRPIEQHYPLRHAHPPPAQRNPSAIETSHSPNVTPQFALLPRPQHSIGPGTPAFLLLHAGYVYTAYLARRDTTPGTSNVLLWEDPSPIDVEDREDGSLTHFADHSAVELQIESALHLDLDQHPDRRVIDISAAFI